jgi:dihydrofolate synthase/folylpolyglutamate synthase
VEVSETDLLEFFGRYGLKSSFENLTYFELATAFSFWWFQKQKVDLVMLEVGLGGRLDATNVIDKPLVSVITSIGMDHMDVLGPTIRDIAREKAGIIKKGCPVVTGELPADAEEVVYAEVDRSKAFGIRSGHISASWWGEQLEIDFEGSRYRIKPDLVGEAQSINVATSLKVVETLSNIYPVERELCLQALKEVVELTGFRGRFERLSKQHPWYFDGGHNPEALEAARKTAQRIFDGNQPTLVVHLMNDKINEEMSLFFSEFEEILYYSTPNKRAASFDSFVATVSQAKPLYEDRIGAFLHRHQHKAVLFLGSFYFYSSVKSWVTRFHSDHPFP